MVLDKAPGAIVSERAVLGWSCPLPLPCPLEPEPATCSLNGCPLRVLFGKRFHGYGAKNC